MIDRTTFVAATKKLLVNLEDDLRLRAKQEEHRSRFEAEHAQAFEKGRTAQDYASWLDERLTQVGAAWILACVFLRFLEDNDFLEGPMLAGPGPRLKRSGEHREAYFGAHPAHSDREFLESLFREIEALPGMRELLDEKTNPLWQIGPSAEGARDLVDFFRAIDPEAGEVAWNFHDEAGDSRFLGDLYQELSEAARKRYALLQTPDFIEEFILDRTLEPALEEFGLERTNLIDPTCGSGHFLLGAFARLWKRREEQGGGEPAALRVQKVLDAVAGVDVNPFAVAIARFRLLLAALRAADCKKLKDAPDFHFQLAAGDSLLHGRRPGPLGLTQSMFVEDDLDTVYEVEDKEALREILGRSYAAVVGNPPYITPKDKALNQAYRERFGSCHMKYALSVPFMERFFDLATADDEASAGFVGKITSNSYMKREFGKKLIEEYFPRWDLSHVIDTSGAYVPGHGTPTVILCGRARAPVAPTVRAVLGIRGEPATPDDPAQGLVWREIVEQLERPGSEGSFVSVDDMDRERLHSHPWSLGGGGAAELKERIEEAAVDRLGDRATSIGITAFTLEDDIFLVPRHAASRAGMLDDHVRPMLEGERIRDWSAETDVVAVFPYDASFSPIEPDLEDHRLRYLWLARTGLGGNKMFGGKTKVECGLNWYEFGRLTSDKLRTPLSITFAFVASHNHFVLDRGGKVFNRSAPVIKLPPEATEDDHLALLGLLNSSTACFWMKQVSHQKQMMGGDGIRVSDRSKVPYEFAGTQLSNLPIPKAFEELPIRNRFRDLAAKLDALAHRSNELSPSAAIMESIKGGRAAIEATWDRYLDERASIRAEMVLLQEELDQLSYFAYGLVSEEPEGLSDKEVPRDMDAGQRPFEILRQENIEGFPVPKVIPMHWPESIQKAWNARIQRLNESLDLRLIEDPHYKRRWIGRQGLFNHTARQDELTLAAASWLLDHLEKCAVWQEHRLVTAAALAERLRDDADFMQVAALYRKRDDFDLVKLVAELSESEGVPFLSALRYKDSGMRKRAAWEKTWTLQREEDATEARGESFSKKIPVPPKYSSADFLKQSYWSHRGKLDVPKERFILYPGAERKGESGPLLGWAGWNEKERCTALYSYATERRDQDGWGQEELLPLMAGILELLPWLEQWHHEAEPGETESFAAQIEALFDEDVRALGLTRKDLIDWRPAKSNRGGGRKKKS